MLLVRVASNVLRLVSNIMDIYSRHINRKGSKILEVSTGFGINTYTLLKIVDDLGGFMVSIDIDPKRVEKARKIFRSYVEKGVLRLEVMDARSLRYEDNSFDYVVSHTTLHHINDVERSLREMTRVLKPLGRIIIVDLRPITPLILIPGHSPRHIARTRETAIKYVKNNLAIIEEGVRGILYYVVASKQ
ncbi:MAG: class I SAM-dependent methyltransferase [Sulfolobales archaeon]